MVMGMSTPEPQHLTYIDPDRDSAGHLSWSCTQLDDDGSGYETARDVLEAATAHGPLAADSPIPTDDDDGPVDSSASTAVSCAADMIARFCPSAKQTDIALGLMRSTPGIAWVVVPIALPGKAHGLWTLGQLVEHPNGFWPVGNDPVLGHGAARTEAERAALAHLAGGPGQPAWAVIRPDGTFSTFEGYGIRDRSPGPLGAQLPRLADLHEFAQHLDLLVPPMVADSRNTPRRQTVVGTALACALAGRVSNHVALFDPHEPDDLASLRSLAALQLVDGDVDEAIALSMVMFAWGTDVLKRLTENDAIDHLVEALGLLFSVHRRGIDPAIADERIRLAAQNVRDAAVDLAVMPRPDENDGPTS